MKQSELKALVEAAMKNQMRATRELEAVKDNPSVAPNYYLIAGHAEALEAVNEALKGNPVLLRMMR